MAEYALLINGEKQEFRHYAERPEHIPHKNVEWYPVVREYGEPFEGVENDAYVIRTVDPDTLPPVVPDRVTPRQARMALLAVGLYETVEALVSAQDSEIQVAWQYSNFIYRNDPFINGLAELINLTPTDLDNLFIAAKEL